MHDTAAPALRPDSTDRYHAVDALRALAMFLGVVLHAGLGFMVTETPISPAQGVILSLFGLFGALAARMARARWVRWLADSSYWVYLVHLPPIYFLNYLTAGYAVPGMSPGPMEAIVKFCGIVGVVTAFCLVTYALLVRPTPLEAIVGGTRSSRRSTQ